MKLRTKDQDRAKVWRAYQFSKSIDKTAKLLHLTPYIVRRILKEDGREMNPPHRPKGIKAVVSHHGCLPRWIEANPGIRLPRSVREISKLTGCSEESVRAYLRRRSIKVPMGSREEPGKPDTSPPSPSQP